MSLYTCILFVYSHKLYFYCTGILTEAILETDAGGLMADLLLMMLTAIFSLQEEEEEEEEELSKQGKEQGTMIYVMLLCLNLD